MLRWVLNWRARSSLFDAALVERLAYIAPDFYASGYQMGGRIAGMVDSGLVALFIATAGQLNIQPRPDGAVAAIKTSGKKIETQQIASGPTVN